MGRHHDKLCGSQFLLACCTSMALLRICVCSLCQAFRLSFAENFVAGGFGGVLSRTLTSPLDVVKILAQVGTKDTHAGFLQSFRNIHASEGIRAFWKGNGIACIRLFPFNGIQFAVYERVKRALKDKNTGELSNMNALVAGGVGGCCASSMTYPLDVIKTRLTVQHVEGKVGAIDMGRQIYRIEGVRGLYRGLVTTVIGIFPFAGMTFMAYNFLGAVWERPREDLSAWQTFLNGCLAAAFSQTTTYPMDLIRKKLQAQGTDQQFKNGVRNPNYYTGAWDCFLKVARSEGFFGLFRGTTANLAKVAPYAGFMFVGYETAVHFLLWVHKCADPQ